VQTGDRAKRLNSRLLGLIHVFFCYNFLARSYGGIAIGPITSYRSYKKKGVMFVILGRYPVAAGVLKWGFSPPAIKYVLTTRERRAFESYRTKISLIIIHSEAGEAFLPNSTTTMVSLYLFCSCGLHNSARLISSIIVRVNTKKNTSLLDCFTVEPCLVLR
jgi:hypothetical protein